MLEKTELYNQFHNKVQNYILAKVKNIFEAEDICSKVFLRIYEKLDSFDEKRASLSTWIFTIANNTLIDYYRTRHVQGEVPETFATSESVEESVCNEEMLETLAHALESLDMRERDIIVFRYYNNLSLKEIAEKIDISYSYVKIMHKKALENLKKYFENV